MIKNKFHAMSTRFPTLETPRLILRRILRSDADDMYEYARLPEVTRYLLWNVHPDRNHTYLYIDGLQSQYRMGKYYDFAVILKENGKMIGTCGFASVDFENDAAEIGYVINPAYQNCGYATEAVLAVMNFGFGTLGLHRIEGRYMSENRQSRRVMDKCGMIYEGDRREGAKVKGKYETVGVSAILKTEFFARKHFGDVN